MVDSRDAIDVRWLDRLLNPSLIQRRWDSLLLFLICGRDSQAVSFQAKKDYVFNCSHDCSPSRFASSATSRAA